MESTVQSYRSRWEMSFESGGEKTQWKTVGGKGSGNWDYIKGLWASAVGGCGAGDWDEETQREGRP